MNTKNIIKKFQRELRVTYGEEISFKEASEILNGLAAYNLLLKRIFKKINARERKTKKILKRIKKVLTPKQ